MAYNWKFIGKAIPFISYLELQERNTSFCTVVGFMQDLLLLTRLPLVLNTRSLGTLVAGIDRTFCANEPSNGRALQVDF